MRLLLLAAIFFISSCGNETSKDPAKITQNTVKPKAGPTEVLTDSVINRFLALNEALIAWDSSQISPLATALIHSMDSLKVGVPADSVEAVKQLDLSKKEMQRLNGSKSLMDKRLAYTRSNAAFFEFLKLNHYSRSTVYFQVCPMAFNDTGLGYWISRTKDIRNPYLGLHHPRYGKSMLDCGHNKDVVNGTLKEDE